MRPNQATVVDMVQAVTPDFVYDSHPRIGGQPTVIRESDRQHLNDAGSELAADAVIHSLQCDFDLGRSASMHIDAH
jgi:hypothetical protein